MPTGKRKAGPSKRAFVLSLPLDMPAKEVIERAAKEGIKLKDTYVYVVRSNARVRKGTAAKPKASTGANHAGSAEADFRRLAIELGLGRSKDLLKQTEQKVAELIAGN